MRIFRVSLAAALCQAVRSAWTYETLDVGSIYFASGFAAGQHGYITQWSGGKIIRFNLGSFDDSEVLDLAGTAAASEKFVGGFADDAHGYAIGNGGKVVRFSLADFRGVQVLDLQQTNSQFTSFRGGFSDGVYGYAIPYSRNSWLVRFKLQDFGAVQSLDVTAGFWRGFIDRNYGYLVPECCDSGYRHGKVTRFRLDAFSSPQVLDVSSSDSSLEGFMSGFAAGDYGYLMPGNGRRPRTGKVVRFSLLTFGGVEVLDMAQTDSELVGFRGGFADATFGYAIPYSNKKAARFRLESFSDVEVLDLQQAASGPDAFWGGFTAGGHGYLAPFGGSKVVRFALHISTTTTSKTSTTTTRPDCAAGQHWVLDGCTSCPEGSHSDGGASPCLPLVPVIAMGASVSFRTTLHANGVIHVVDLVATELPKQVYGGSTLEYAVDIAKSAESLAEDTPCGKLWQKWNGNFRVSLKYDDLDATCPTNMSVTAEEVVRTGYIAAFLLERQEAGTRVVKSWHFPIRFSYSRSIAAYYNPIYALSSTLRPTVNTSMGTVASVLQLFQSSAFASPHLPSTLLFANDALYLEHSLVQALPGMTLEVTAVWMSKTADVDGPVLHNLLNTMEEVERGTGKVRFKTYARGCVNCYVNVKSNLKLADSRGRRLRGPSWSMASIYMSVLDVREESVANPNAARLILDVPYALLLAFLTSVAFSLLTRAAIARTPGCPGFIAFAVFEALDIVSDVATWFFCYGSGDLEFSNDGHGVLQIVLITSTAFNFALLLLEVCVYSFGPRFLGAERTALRKAWMPFVTCIHLFTEDCFQFVLYSLVAASHANTGLEEHVSAVIAVIQCVVFILCKMRDALDWSALAAKFTSSSAGPAASAGAAAD